MISAIRWLIRVLILRDVNVATQPVNQARWARFRHNRRGYWSLWIFLVLFGLSLCSELIANDKPLLVRYDGSWYFPLLKNYSESDFGGPLASQADYQDPWLKQRLENNGWVLWAPIRFGATSINFATDKPFPSPPSRQNWLGTDANGGDVLARILYGTRISVLFGLMLTLCSSVMGVLAGRYKAITAVKSISGDNALLKYGRGCRRCFDYFTFQRRTA